ncbi:MAG: hypothetical protein BWZ08_00286 [candidate division BRC1 bacterium ADurb.BinA292]|nr:MAG: hypothetical protein BWZ08_00286 [candidate division BRC1 bacterium ADurb.BinA292]
MFGLTGVHEIQFRFFFISTQYAADAPNEHIVEGTWDWVRGGMRAGANINIAKYCVGWPAASGDATPVRCGFVGPPDGAPTGTSHPTLDWTAPAGYPDVKYTVTLSQDPHFRGPTTITVHDLPHSQLTIGPLDLGTWYWTVIPVNYDDIAGQDMFKGMSAYWNDPQYYTYYSFEVDSTVPTELSHFVFE